MKHLGVTGTRKGATARQLDMLAHLLAVCKLRGFSNFHDGDCIGVDVEARSHAKEHGYRLIVHPSTAKTRAFNPMYDELREPRKPMLRNKDIVDECALMIGLPGLDHEILRSGTWACLRYTGKSKCRTIIVLPSGELKLYPEGYKA